MHRSGSQWSCDSHAGKRYSVEAIGGLFPGSLTDQRHCCVTFVDFTALLETCPKLHRLVLAKFENIPVSAFVQLVGESLLG